VPLFVGLTFLRAVVALQLPAFRAPAEQPTVAASNVVSAARLRDIVLKPWFVLPLIGFAMIFGTHIILNAFASLLWKEQGISEDIIGPLIALAAAAEVRWSRLGAQSDPSVGDDGSAPLDGHGVFAAGLGAGAVAADP
jgi:PPP family 3-phenylpropionic acid transporter